MIHLVNGQTPISQVTTPYIVISVLLMLSLDFGQFIGFIGLMLLVVHQEKHLVHKIE